MQNNHSIKPEDILKDGVDSIQIDGKSIRKGTVAAFLANTEILEHSNSSEQHKQEAMNMLKELAPAVVTVGLHKHVVFKNAQVEQILVEAKESMSN